MMDQYLSMALMKFAIWILKRGLCFHNSRLLVRKFKKIFVCLPKSFNIIRVMLWFLARRHRNSSDKEFYKEMSDDDGHFRFPLLWETLTKAFLGISFSYIFAFAWSSLFPSWLNFLRHQQYLNVSMFNSYPRHFEFTEPHPYRYNMRIHKYRAQNFPNTMVLPCRHYNQVSSLLHWTCTTCIRDQHKGQESFTRDFGRNLGQNFRTIPHLLITMSSWCKYGFVWKINRKMKLTGAKIVWLKAESKEYLSIYILNWPAY